MTSLAKVALAALFLFGVPLSATHAWSEENPPAQKSSGDAGKQFDEAGRQIGQGAEHVGQGIKEGAIQAWEAVKAGAHAVGDKLSGDKSASPKKAEHDSK